MSTTCPRQISGAIVGDNGVVMLRMNEHLSAEDDGLPLAEHLSETYSPWYTIKLNYIAPDDYIVPADQMRGLTPAEAPPGPRPSCGTRTANSLWPGWTPAYTT